MSRSPGKRRLTRPIRNQSSLMQACEACAALLSPIACQFSNEGFGISLFLQIAKHAYVVSSARAMRLAGHRPTVSRIAAVTGLSRKEIKQLVALPDQGTALEKLSPAMKVARGWRTDKDFISRSGRPKAIGMDGPNGFRDLVNRHAGDVPHVAVLLEMERLLWLRRLPKGRLVLQLIERPAQHRMASAFATKLSRYAVALERVKRGELMSYAGFREAVVLDPKSSASLVRSVSTRAEELLSGFERRATRASAKEQRIQGPSEFLTLGIFIANRAEPGVKGNVLEPPAKPTRRAKRA